MTRNSCFPGEEEHTLAITEFCRPYLLQLNSVTRYILTSELQLKLSFGVHQCVKEEKEINAFKKCCSGVGIYRWRIKARKGDQLKIEGFFCIE